MGIMNDLSEIPVSERPAPTFTFTGGWDEGVKGGAWISESPDFRPSSDMTSVRSLPGLSARRTLFWKVGRSGQKWRRVQNTSEADKAVLFRYQSAVV